MKLYIITITNSQGEEEIFKQIVANNKQEAISKSKLSMREDERKENGEKIYSINLNDE